jgi:hypothetical protein
MALMTNNKQCRVVFKPSNVHQGHYVEINGESTDLVVNLFAYKTIKKYKVEVDEKIEKLIDQNNEQR